MQQSNFFFYRLLGIWIEIEFLGFPKQIWFYTCLSMLAYLYTIYINSFLSTRDEF